MEATKKRAARRWRSRLTRLAWCCPFVALGLMAITFTSSYPSLQDEEVSEKEESTSVGRCPLQAGQESEVNITTKGLYDTLLFDDVEGGVWRQGWDVQYAGSEWNDRVLEVHVVPHSHNDPGWLQTFEQYYEKTSRGIISTIVQILLEDPQRHFIWEEMSYLQHWWQDADSKDREDLRKVVRSGQLEIVGGGWVMNDEANSHMFAIIDQISEGNTWLHDAIGVVPSSSWAIDPFGHSPTMAYLLPQMGIDNMLIQRTHYEVKRALARTKQLEFFWRQSWDTGASTDVLTHMMPFYHYDVAHTCGPDPRICCQFDFARQPVGVVVSCQWGINAVAINEENVKARAEMLLDQWRKKSTLYPTNVLLVPMGDDFRYISIDEARLQFENYERMFKYLNNNKELRVEAKWSTLTGYFDALRKESLRLQQKPPTAC